MHLERIDLTLDATHHVGRPELGVEGLDRLLVPLHRQASARPTPRRRRAPAGGPPRPSNAAPQPAHEAPGPSRGAASPIRPAAPGRPPLCRLARRRAARASTAPRPTSAVVRRRTWRAPPGRGRPPPGHRRRPAGRGTPRAPASPGQPVVGRWRHGEQGPGDRSWQGLRFGSADRLADGGSRGIGRTPGPGGSGILPMTRERGVRTLRRVVDDRSTHTAKGRS